MKVLQTNKIQLCHLQLPFHLFTVAQCMINGANPCLKPESYSLLISTFMPCTEEHHVAWSAFLLSSLA